jgi:hypothetical protein
MELGLPWWPGRRPLPRDRFDRPRWPVDDAPRRPFGHAWGDPGNEEVDRVHVPANRGSKVASSRWAEPRIPGVVDEDVYVPNLAGQAVLHTLGQGYKYHVDSRAEFLAN